MIKFIVPFAVLLAGCTSSSKTENGTSDSTAVEHETAPADARVDEAADTTEVIMLTDVTDPNIGDTEADMVPELPWSYRFYGFSNTTPVLAAYEQFGAAAPASAEKGDLEFYAVNVAKNDYAAKPYRLSGVADGDAAGKNYIQKYNIEHGLVANNYTKTSLKTQEPEPVVNTELVINSKKFVVRLLQKTRPISREENVVLFELHLINPATKEGWMLQSDESLPQSRGKVLSYQLADAYTSGDNVAIMILYVRTASDKDGKEYFMNKYLMVTGSVASKPNFNYEPSKTEICTLNDIGMGDCSHIEFSCGDFGDAETILSIDDQARWDDLSDDDGDMKPQYKGKSFEITYTTTYGKTCGDPGDTNPSTTNILVTGFRMK